MVKVCHIISGDLWAGAEVMACSLLKGLRGSAALELSVILLNEGRLAEEIKRLEIPVTICSEAENSFLPLYRLVRKEIGRLQPDIIHAHRYKENMLACLAARGRGIRLISTQHGMSEPTAELSLKNSLIARLNLTLLARCFEKVVAVSDDIRTAFLSRYGFDRSRVVTIHNGIEITAEVPDRGGTPLVIGSLGRLFPVKDYPLMLAVAKLVCAARVDVIFELSGDGVEKEKLIALIQDAGLDGRFLLQGFVADTAPVYRATDIYINTSVHEGIPMSVLEAMSWGIPVVAPRVGGFSEIITDGVEGFLIESRSPQDFAVKCLELCGNAVFCRQIGRAARDKVAGKFSLEAMSNSYLQLYLPEMHSAEGVYEH